jgi:hypothetical protein
MSNFTILVIYFPHNYYINKLRRITKITNSCHLSIFGATKVDNLLIIEIFNEKFLVS